MQWVSTKFPMDSYICCILCTSNKRLQNLENNFSTSLDSSFDSCPHISDENSKIGLTKELNVSSTVFQWICNLR